MIDEVLAKLPALNLEDESIGMNENSQETTVDNNSAHGVLRKSNQVKPPNRRLANNVKGLD